MPSISTQATVLRHVNYRDNDRMLALFSPTLGRIDAIARGCRKAKSALCGATELFCTGEYQFYQSRDRLTLTGCAIRESYYPIREDYDRLVHGAYLLALCEASVQPGEEHAGLYARLLGALAHLAYGGHERSAPALTAVSLLQFAESLGYRPSLDACAHCGAALPDGGAARFDALAGGAVCPACGPAAESICPDALRFLRTAQREGFDCAGPETIGEAHAEALLRMRRYLESRIERSVNAAKLLPRTGE